MRSTKKAFNDTGVGLGQKCCDGYRGRLRTTRMLWYIQRLAKVQKGGYCVHWGGLGHKDCCDGYRGRLRTARILWLLQRLPEYNKSGFCCH